MRVARLVAVALLVIAGRVFTPDLIAQAKPVPADCNRACLEGLMEQYIAALLAHDPTRLPLSADVKYPLKTRTIFAPSRRAMRASSAT